jgi:hypothetical protein
MFDLSNRLVSIVKIQVMSIIHWKKLYNIPKLHNNVPNGGRVMPKHVEQIKRDNEELRNATTKHQRNLQKTPKF